MFSSNQIINIILIVLMFCFYDVDCNQHLYKKDKKDIINKQIFKNNSTIIKADIGKSNVTNEENPLMNTDNEMMIERPKINMLDIISGMGKAIHLLLNQRNQIIKSHNFDNQESSIREESNLTTTTTHEPINIFRSLKVNGKIPPEGFPKDYAAQANALRQQIVRRCNQLQNIISTTNEILRERENYMFAKILENFSSRIEQTKIRADLILKEPSTSEMAVKALNRINFGLNNINHLIQNVLSRVNVSINLDMNESKPSSANKTKKDFHKESKKENKLADLNKKSISNSDQLQKHKQH